MRRPLPVPPRGPCSRPSPRHPEELIPITTPTLKSLLPAGSILTQHVDSDFSDYIAGRPATQRLVLAVVQVAAVHASTQEKGRSNKATYETVHAVEITDPHEADQLRHRITQIKADRGLLARQPDLFDESEDDQRDQLIDMICEWASENDVPMVDVDTRFVDYFGGAEHASAETVQACRSVAQLREFAFVVGAIAEDEPAPEPTAPPVVFADGAEPTEDDELEDDEA